MADLRSFTLWARALLTREAEELLLQIYGLENTGYFLPQHSVPILARVEEARDTRARLEKLFADEKDAGITASEAHKKLVKEVAFTHLNRLVAFKFMEGCKLIRGTLDRYHDSNGFKIYLADHEEDLKLHERGSMPQDDLGEGPSDQAYRHFLLWQCRELAKEVRVLFDVDNLPSRLFPRPRILRELVERFNAEDMKQAWAPGNEETIGWVYQFFNAEEKDAAFERVFKEREKFQKDDIPAATQVFTPRWIVRFLVENSLGRLWATMHPDSKLAEELQYLVPLPGDPARAPLKPVRDIRLLDPATGTMHFGLVAFDLLMEMYREELKNAGKEGWPSTPSVPAEEDIPAAILSSNLFGVDIDLRAVQLASLALFLRAKATSRNCVLTESNLACADVAIFRGHHLSKIAGEMALPTGVTRDLFRQFCESVDQAALMGSLVRLEKHFRNLVGGHLRALIDDYVREKAKHGEDESYFGNESSKGLRLLDVLTRRYDVVFTNPPYMSKRNMNPPMAEFMRSQYKKSKGDLYAGFIDRCAELLTDGGRLAMVTQQSFMFISTYEKLRCDLLVDTALETLLHLGPRAFPEVQGEKVNTAAYVLRREELEQMRGTSCGVYFRMIKEADANAKKTGFEHSLQRWKNDLGDTRVYQYRQADIQAIPGSPWAYWTTPSLRALFSRLGRLEGVAKPWVGLQTSDNPRFLRYWWEVGLDRIGQNCRTEVEALASRRRWFPHMKGGEYRRWYGNQHFVVDWGEGGRIMKEFAESLKERVKSPPGNGPLRPFPFYFREGITWTHTTPKGLNARYMPHGYICNVEGMACYPSTDSGLLEAVLGVLNSSFASYITNQLNPTIHYGAKELGQLPWPLAIEPAARLHLRDEVGRAVALSREFDQEDETTFDFVCPAPWRDGIVRGRLRNSSLAAIGQTVDDLIFASYEISDSDRQLILDELKTEMGTSELDDEGEIGEDDAEPIESTELTQAELANRWVHYAVGIALDRFKPGMQRGLGRGNFPGDVGAKLQGLSAADGLMVIDEGHPDDLPQRVLDILHVIHTDAEVEQVILTLTGPDRKLRHEVADYLFGSFFKEHAKRYRKRPIYWLLQSPERKYSVYLFHERTTADTLALLQGNRYLGGKIHSVESKLQQAKQKEAASSGHEKATWSRQARDLAELLDDLCAFDQRITAVNNVQIQDRDGHPVTVRWQPELDDGVLLNAAPLHELAPAWKRADSKLDLKKVWKDLEDAKYDWAKTAMRYWPQRVLKACKQNKSFAIAHGLV